MEVIINANSFTISKLNKLRNHLEKYQIKEIHNNLELEDEIIIVFNKERMKLNEKIKFKVTSIRNRYYRQLKNIIDLSTHRAVVEVIIDSDSKNINLDKYIFNSNKDKLKMALINYIGVYNFDNIFELSKEEMLELRKYKCLNNDSDYLIKLLGAYIPTNRKESVIKYLEEIVETDKLKEIKKCNSFILICNEIINEFCIDNYDKFKDCGVIEIFELYNIVFNKVLVHEIGHGVFCYYIYDSRNENRANYFASLTLDGTFDKIIKRMTDIQGEKFPEYKNPTLLTYDDEIINIKEKIYNI